MANHIPFDQRQPTRLGAHYVNVHPAFRQAEAATTVTLSKVQRKAMSDAIDREVEMRMQQARILEEQRRAKDAATAAAIRVATASDPAPRAAPVRAAGKTRRRTGGTPKRRVKG